MTLEETDRMVNPRTLVPEKLVRLAVILTGVLLRPPADKMHTHAVRAAEEIDLLPAPNRG